MSSKLNKVVNVLTNNEPEPKNEISRSHRRALSKSLSYFVDNLTNFSEICVCLVSKEVFTFSEMDEIKSHRTMNDKLMEMMNKMMRKGIHCYNAFMEVLDENQNDHVAKEINRQHQMVQSEGHTRHKKKNRKKKNRNSKDDDDDSSCSESEDENDIHALVDYLLFIEWYLKSLDYDPSKIHTAYRFNNPTSSIPQGINEKPNMTQIFGKYKGRQRFRVNRAIYLDQIGFYGPELAKIASYEIEAKITFWPDKGQVIGCMKEVIEVGNKNIMYVCPRGDFQMLNSSGISFIQRPSSLGNGRLFPVPIRPHVWHMLTFEIKGRNIMVGQKQENIKKSVKIKYILDADSGDEVEFEFDTVGYWSSCQMPELIFFKGKDKVQSSHFPKKEKTLWNTLSNFILKFPQTSNNQTTIQYNQTNEEININ